MLNFCGIVASYPQIDLSKDKTGIFGKIAKLDTVLRPKDRVEISDFFSTAK
jgi:putative ubiquitin-RnfH superfamily antitoxin RatB of RatAB toxin-antitoxin module